MKSQLPIARQLNRPLAKPIKKKAEKHYSHNHLQSLLDGFVDFSGVENCDLSFKGLSINSKKVHEEYLFLACASVGHGLQKDIQHGIAYAGEAINFGANCIAWEPMTGLEDMPGNCSVERDGEMFHVPLIQVEALHDKVGEIAARFYQHPSHLLNVIGITGTNGKTSIAHFIAQLIYDQDAVEKNESKGATKKCAVIGTLGNGFYGQLEAGTHTTPDAVTVQELIAGFRDKQAETLVMEVSSHALSQGRVNGVEFDCAIFTNLTRDHLDYHGDMRSYADEKLKLFQFSSLKQIVLNQDDSFSKIIIESIKRDSYSQKLSIIRYSREDRNAEYFADSISLSSEGISFTLHINDQAAVEIKTSIVGDFNIENILASIAALHSQGYDLDTIVSSVGKLAVVPGRMEKITLPSSEDGVLQDDLPLIVVDYAHTPDAIEKVLCALRTHTRGQLICLFGCGGDRDKGKRPLMAEIAEQLADQIVVTSDNPRTESPDQIIADIMGGFKNSNNVVTEVEREKAIYSTLSSINADDVVLIAGKGHEDYQEINGQRLPFSDKGCVHRFYKEHLTKRSGGGL